MTHLKEWRRLFDFFIRYGTSLSLFEILLSQIDRERFAGLTMDDGRWTVDGGQWTMDDGPLTIDG
jgi:hypothetical protein